MFKKLLSLIALITVFALGCANGGPTPSAEEPNSSSSSQLVAPLTCTPVIATATPFLSCGALASTSITAATDIQTQLIAQMNLALASLTITPDFVANQVVITSSAAQFSTFFGAQIVAPLISSGVFMTSIPIVAPFFPDGFTLTANIFGMVPGIIPVSPTVFTPALTTSIANTAAIDTTATVGATNAASFGALTATTMPLTVFITTPVGLTAPFTCSGALPLGCL